MLHSGKEQIMLEFILGSIFGGTLGVFIMAIFVGTRN